MFLYFKSFSILVGSLLWSLSAPAAFWPTEGWFSGPPQGGPIVTVGFVLSPYDLRSDRILRSIKRLDKKYRTSGVAFVISWVGESGLPLREPSVAALVKDERTQIAMHLDFNKSFSKSLSILSYPTVFVLNKELKPFILEAGATDPFQIEKLIIKSLKEAGLTALPPREYASETEFKNCDPGHTYFVDAKSLNIWGKSGLKVDPTGCKMTENGIELSHEGLCKLEWDVPEAASSVGILAESTSKTGEKISVSYGTAPESTLSVNELAVLDVPLRGAGSASAHLKVLFKSKGVRVHALQTLSNCADLK